MPSIVEGYTYDIFISYRQNDNKYDGWVTEFVNNLNKELEANIKDKVSVYFDINPTDGLLETHSVDRSLEGKLKCLIFIPIISRTYCDSKSFAWQHEFCAFNKLAKADKFGREIRLSSGNVTSRILPIKIHDLDPEDKTLLENELGGVLRSIEFIYKSAGVNRPLRPNEDHPQDNLNKTYYRDQINKVANAVKEVISALKKQSQHHEEGLKRDLEPKPASKQNLKTKIIAGILTFLLFLVAGYFIFSRFLKPPENPEKSIAVLPFRNLSGDSNRDDMSDALTNEIINHLYKIKSFDRVVPFSSVMAYKNSDKKNITIADELNANYLLHGTYQLLGDSVKIIANLIEPKTDKYLWQNDYHKPYKEIISIQSDIAIQIAANVDAFITVSEKQNIQKIPTTNQAAYDTLQKAIIHTYTFFRIQNADYDTFTKKGKDLALKAIELDSNYSDAYAWAGIYSLYSGSYAGTKELSEAIMDALPDVEKALELDQNNYTAHFLMGNIYEWGRWDYIKAEKEYLKVLELAPNKVDGFGLYGYGQYIEFYIKMNQLDKVRYFIAKARENDMNISSNLLIFSSILSGNKKVAYDTLNSITKLQESYSYKRIGENFIWLEEYDSARFYLEKAIKTGDIQMSIPRFEACLALAYKKTNNDQRANTIINELIQKSKVTSAGSPEYFIGWYYSGIGEADSAFHWLDKACNKHSAEMPWLKVNPVFKNIKIDNRYRDLYKRTGHKAYDDYIESMNK